MTIAQSFELDLNRFGLRFASQDTEAAYRRWHLDQNRWLIVVALGAVIAGWTAAIVGGWLWVPDVTARAMPYIAPLMVGLVIVVGLVSWSRFDRAVWPVTALVWATLQAVQVTASLGLAAPILGSTLALAGATMAVMLTTLFAPFMRVPLHWSAIAVTPGVAAIVVVGQVEFQNGDIDRLSYGFGALMIVVTWVTVMFIITLLERESRRTFVDEHVIEEQRVALAQSAALVRRYVPHAVAQRIDEGRAEDIEIPRRQRVTVLFADIVGFTRIADRVEPEEMTQILNDYMSTMAELVDEHGGTVNEFAGDGLMALFGAPDAMDAEEQARRAVRAAQAMQGALPALNQQWRTMGLDSELAARIGINTGIVSVGSYGSQGRMTYTAIGLQTNIAARIESMAEPGQILISESTWKLVCESLPCESRGEVECKGVHFPVKVYVPAEMST